MKHPLTGRQYTTLRSKTPRQTTVALSLAGTLVNTGKVETCEAGQLWAVLPSDIIVLNLKGKSVKPAQGKRFLISTQTTVVHYICEI